MDVTFLTFRLGLTNHTIMMLSSDVLSTVQITPCRYRVGERAELCGRAVKTRISPR